MGDTCIIDKHIDLRKMSKHFFSKSLYKRGITDIPGKGQDFDMIDGAQILRQIFQHLFDFSGRPVPDDSPLWQGLWLWRVRSRGRHRIQMQLYT